ncbi:hypothetical protein AMTR_s00113p00137090 [Amborella trichopoda]|uniref:Uncharacterized protein n=1 Tax=Amborella trichopoda TaxID=13333 RepID=W1NV38_AMBTC|nr:hypothetical protein AMTR_s00113p00137090 [Amborella trichopoda]
MAAGFCNPFIWIGDFLIPLFESVPREQGPLTSFPTILLSKDPLSGSQVLTWTDVRRDLKVPHSPSLRYGGKSTKVPCMGDTYIAPHSMHLATDKSLPGHVSEVRRKAAQSPFTEGKQVVIASMGRHKATSYIPTPLVSIPKGSTLQGGNPMVSTPHAHHKARGSLTQVTPRGNPLVTSRPCSRSNLSRSDPAHTTHVHLTARGDAIIVLTRVHRRQPSRPPPMHTKAHTCSLTDTSS